MHELPGIRTDLGIAKLTPKDVLGKSDHFSFLTDLVGANDDMYPGIEKWFQKKVVPGIKSGERVAYLGMVDGDPFASAILKKGKRSKICHIKIGRSFQDQNLGELFFILMGFEVRHLAKEVYFTLPESLWRAKRHFFESFGFADATRSGTQYRFFDTEFLCKTNFQNFWSRIIEKNSKLMNCYSLNGKSANSGLLLSIKPKYADRIMNGTKTVEVRRTFSTKWQGQPIKFYASSPTKAIIGEAQASRIIFGRPDEIWNRYWTKLGCTQKEFNDYVKGLTNCYAIELDHINPYSKAFGLEMMSSLLNETLRPPQTYFRVSANDSWSRALSITSLVYSQFVFSSGDSDDR